MRGKTAAVSGSVLGLVVVAVGVAAGKAPAWADCCPGTGSAIADPHVSALGSTVGSTLGPAPSALATTGAAVTIAVAVGLALMATGALLIALAGSRWRWLPRPGVLGVGAAILVVATLLSGGTAAAGPRPAAVASGCCPAAVATDPPPVLPETPLAVLLPLGAVAVGALAFARQRRGSRRRSTGPDR